MSLAAALEERSTSELEARFARAHRDLIEQQFIFIAVEMTAMKKLSSAVAH
jgi:hypothetical protein